MTPLLGPYRIVEKIGEGGMGEVFRARDTRLNRDVAIKILPSAFAADADRRARFEREAQAVAALSHPNIVSLFDTGVHDGQMFVVMELLDGVTLRDILADGRLPARKAIEMGVQIARGLAAAHDKGLVHRDLKPENIFVLRDGQVKILDFGLARLMTTSPAGCGAVETIASVTHPGGVIGTVGYMAPEQVRGQAVDARCDLFAMGAVLHEMLSGRRAFHRDTAAETMTAILKEDPPDLSSAASDISPALDRVIRHCLEKNPVERFQTARDVAFALAGSSQSTSSAAGVVPATRRRRVPRWAATAALVLAVALSAFVLDRAFAPAAAARVSFTQKTFAQQMIFNARFMPDGQTLVFSAALADNTPQLFEIRPDKLVAQSFGPPRSHLLSVSSKGDLAVLTDTHYINQYLFTGTLARLSMDGSPQPWMEHVREADWGPDGGTLAIVHDMGAEDRLEYPKDRVLYRTTGYVSDVRVSPDGTLVAFMDHQKRYDDRGWIKVVNTSGRVTTLAGEYWGEEGIAWSHDGSTVFFSATERQTAGEAWHPQYQVFGVRIARPGVTTLAVSSPGDFIVRDIADNGRWLGSRSDPRGGIAVRIAGENADRDLSWLDKSTRPKMSRDGQRLLFTDNSDGDNYAVVWRKTDGSPVSRLGPGEALAFSPDEHWALGLIPAPPQLVLYPLGAGDQVRMPRGVIERYQTAYWFPDGNSLLVVGNEPSKPTRAYRQAIPGGLPTPLLPEGVTPAAIVPDGQTILASDTNHAWRWYPVNGGAPRPAVGFATNADYVVVGWAADSKSPMVTTGNDVPARIESIDFTTGRRQFVGEVRPVDRSGVFMLSPATVSADGRQYAYSYQKELSALFVVTGAK